VETIELSDAVVRAATCPRCGPTAVTRALIGRAARSVDANAMFCFGCGAEAVRIDLADCLSVDELARELGACKLPLAFVRVGDRLFDLTGPEDGNG
jgi:hypothetical protein